MSFPNVIFGDYGDEKVAQSTKIGNLPLGTLMVLPDGRKFRHAQASALVAGNVIVGNVAGVASHGAVSGSGLLASATTTYNAIGDTAVHVTMAGTVATLNQYTDGFLNVTSSAGVGYVYKIKGNKSAASVSDLEITLEGSDPLKVAFAAGSTAVTLRKNPYKDSTILSRSATVGTLQGVTPVAVSANFYFWVQRGGPCGVKNGGTVFTNGTPVICSSVVSGSGMAAGSAYTVANLWGPEFIGIALEVATAAEPALVDLRLE